MTARRKPRPAVSVAVRGRLLRTLREEAEATGRTPQWLLREIVETALGWRGGGSLVKAIIDDEARP